MKPESLTNALLDLLKKVSSEDFIRTGTSINLFQYKREPEKDLAPSKVPLLSAYPNIEKFIADLENGDPATLVAAVDFATEINASAIEEVVIAALNMNPWRTLRNSLLKLLGGCKSEASFLALINARPFNANEFRRNQFPGAAVYIEEFFKNDKIVHDFEPWPQFNFNEWQAISIEAQTLWTAEASHRDAIYSFDELDLRQSFLMYLGEHEFTLDLDWVYKLWTTHPAKKIRLGAGHCLLKRLKGKDLSRLSDHIFCIDAPIQMIAFFALMLESPSSASTRLKSKMRTASFNCFDEANSKFLTKLLDTLWGKHLDSKENPWLLQDKGWIDFLLEVKSIPSRRADAAEMLSHFPAEWITNYSNGKTNTSKTVKLKLPKGEQLIEEFSKGQSVKVWKKLYALGKAVRLPELLPHAEWIAAETMKEVRKSLETIVLRLTQMGYVFLNKPIDDVNTIVVNEKILQLEAQYHPLPLSLKAMFIHIGGCDLRGYHPDWPISSTAQPGFDSRKNNIAWYTDPLVLTNVEEILHVANATNSTDIEIVLSGDAITKAGISGGQYSILLPAEEADVTLIGDSKKRMLVEYLWDSLKQGGFAGFKSSNIEKEIVKKILLAEAKDKFNG